MVETEQSGEPREGNPRRFGSGEYVLYGLNPGNREVWRVLDYTDKGRVIIVKTVDGPTVSGEEESLVKRVPEDELTQMQLPKSGDIVRVRRSSGKLEDGWTVSDYQDKNAIVTKGEKAKSIPLSELMAMQEEKE